MHKDNHNQQREVTVVVIDDEPLIVKTLQNVVAKLESSWSFVAFGSAEEFLESELSFPCCCMLLDVNLPGMSGLDLLEILADREPTLPVIIMSGRIEEHAEEAIRLGAFAVSPKPFDKDFLANVSEAIAKQQRPSHH